MKITPQSVRCRAVGRLCQTLIKGWRFTENALQSLSTEGNEANEGFVEGGALRRRAGSQLQRYGLAGACPSIR